MASSGNTVAAWTTLLHIIWKINLLAFRCPNRRAGEGLDNCPGY
jgi:hypothetical protein